MLLSTDVHCIEAENRTWKGRKGDIKLQLIRKVSPLEVSTTSFVSVTAWRYNPGNSTNN
uniref:Uncharacterized protein n=1 Tax=Rhizophora mucronata TaxID=61149 RepID=A0A2P2M8D3_RHIMU